MRCALEPWLQLLEVVSAFHDFNGAAAYSHIGHFGPSLFSRHINLTGPLDFNALLNVNCLAGLSYSVANHPGGRTARGGAGSRIFPVGIEGARPKASPAAPSCRKPRREGFIWRLPSFGIECVTLTVPVCSGVPATAASYLTVAVPVPGTLRGSILGRSGCCARFQLSW